MAKRKSKAQARTSHFPMILDGHSASSVSKNLGIGNTNLLYRRKAEPIDQGGPMAEALDGEVRQLRTELQRTRRERDILRKVLAIFNQQE